MPSETAAHRARRDRLSAARRCRRGSSPRVDTTARWLVRAAHPLPAARLPTTPRTTRASRSFDSTGLRTRATFERLAQAQAHGYLTIAAAIWRGRGGQPRSAITPRARHLREAHGGQDIVNDQILSSRRTRRAPSAIGRRPPKRCCASTTSSRYRRGSGGRRRARAAARHHRSAGLQGRSRTGARLYGARRYSDARARSPPSRARSSGDDREVVDLRIAECDYFLQRYQQALDGLRPWLDRGSRTGRSALLLSERAPRSRARRGVSRADAGARPRLSPTAHGLRKRSTTSAPTTSSRTTTRAARRSTSCTGSSRRPARRTRRVEAGWWAYKNGDCGNGPRLRAGGGGVSAVGLPAVVPLLVGAVARQAGRGTTPESRLRLVSPTTATRTTAASPGARFGARPGRSPPTASRPGQSPAIDAPTCQRPAHPAAARRPTLRRCVERAALRAAKRAVRRRSSRRRWRGRITGRASCAGPSR